MKKLIFLTLFVFIYFKSYSQARNSEIRNAKMGRLVSDLSPIYHLPYLDGKKYLLAQAYNSSFSHKNELSLDFKMKQGSQICVARNGIVVAFEDKNTQGGLNEKYLALGNYIILEHEDKSRAMYWHLQHKGVKVNLGQNVFAGQFIGLSGNTGYTAFPHLHFQVQDANGKDILTRFLTNKGIKYLRPARKYKAVKL